MNGIIATPVLDTIIDGAALQDVEEFHDYIRIISGLAPPGKRITDIHLREDEEPLVVINDRVVRVIAPEVPKDVIDGIIAAFTDHARKTFDEKMDADGRVKLPSGDVLRVHAFRHAFGTRALTIRVQPPKPYGWTEMGLPNHLLNLLDRDQGLIIFAGPVGSRKTSALHAMLDYINREHQAKHILSIDDPPEFTHRSVNALFTQREIGYTTPDYETALVGALRVRPNIVAIGEARDNRTIDAAILSAMLGRLALTSVHAQSATEVRNRIMQSYPIGQRDEVMSAFDDTILAIVALRVVPTVDGGMTIAWEILRNTQQTKPNLGAPIKLRGYMGSPDQTDMNTMEQCLFDLASAGRISPETAMAYAPSTRDMENLLEAL